MTFDGEISGIRAGYLLCIRILVIIRPRNKRLTFASSGTFESSKFVREQ